MIKKCAFLGILLVVSLSLKAQENFDHYIPLKSKGAVPTDFSKSTLAKVKEDSRADLNQLSKSKREFFVEQLHYSIDEIIRSGAVTFGDTLSTYVQEIGDRLVKGNKNLEGKLRFYIYNSTQANAFSTRQGIVFITTGLIAQFTTEAQLAFVLAHEIVHYEKQHVLDLFQFASKEKFVSRRERSRLLNNYSRDNELQADKLAVEMVYRAGYKASEINKTFDVLLFSYLPFEELKFDKTYFNTDEMYVPSIFFDFKPIEISAKHKYNDYLHSHPNLEKRKIQVDEQIALFPDWKDQLYQDSVRFFYMRDVARFEYVRNKVYDNEPVEALYAIYILEQKFPKSTFLNKCKAQAWLDIMQSTISDQQEGRLNLFDGRQTVNTGRRNYEGQISVFNQLFYSLPRVGKLAMGLRQIKDVFTADTSASYAKNSWKAAVEIVAKSEDFYLPLFSKSTYREKVQEIAQNVQDSTVIGHASAPQDKYQTIENQSKGLDNSKSIDSTKFYFYGLSDVIQDSAFLSTFRLYTNSKLETEKEDDEYNRMKDSDQFLVDDKKYEQALFQDMDSLLFMHPAVFETRKNDEVRVQKTLKTTDLMYEAVENAAEDLRMHVQFLGLKETENSQVHDWNKYNLLVNSLTRAVKDFENDYFVFDLEELHQISRELHVNKLLYVEFQHAYKPNLYFGNVALFTVLLPVGLFYFPVELLSAHSSDWQFYVLDLTTGKLTFERSYFTSEPANKHALGTKMYSMFSSLKNAKDEQ